MSYTVVLEREADGGFVASVPGSPRMRHAGRLARRSPIQHSGGD
jgi:hypothetical protein